MWQLSATLVEAAVRRTMTGSGRVTEKDFTIAVENVFGAGGLDAGDEDRATLQAIDFSTVSESNKSRWCSLWKAVLTEDTKGLHSRLAPYTQHNQVVSAPAAAEKQSSALGALTAVKLEGSAAALPPAQVWKYVSTLLCAQIPPSSAATPSGIAIFVTACENFRRCCAPGADLFADTWQHGGFPRGGLRRGWSA